MKGFSLVEILVAVAVLLASFVSVLTAFQVAARHGRGTLEQVQGAALAEEGIEAITAIRDTGWSNFASLAVGSEYYLNFDGTKWVTTATPQMIDGVFRRTFVLNDVYRRNSDKDIVMSTSTDAKAVDAGARKVTVRVSWATTTPQAGERVMETYLMNLFE
ncbi:MAG: prepilin-type N-terminal cleavage/methylation domain-containing protein [bacterium]|nr:prepilin-type N-terminal cleavage/methylation domain-containing protein [bacterium]